MYKTRIVLAVGISVAFFVLPPTTVSASAASGNDTTASAVGRVIQDEAIASAVIHSAAPGDDILRGLRVYVRPKHKYTRKTCLADTTEPDHVTVKSERLLGNGCDRRTVNFSRSMETLSVPAGWAEWGSPPNTEDSTPDVWSTRGGDAITLNFNTATKRAGVEIEPSEGVNHRVYATFYFNDGTTFTYNRTMNGAAGAKLMAVRAPRAVKITTIRLSDSHDKGTVYDFAIAQIRAKR